MSMAAIALNNEGFSELKDLAEKAELLATRVVLAERRQKLGCRMITAS